MLVTLSISVALGQAGGGLPVISEQYKKIIAPIQIPICPPEAFLMDVKLSYSNQRKIWCQKKIDTAYINHGLELIYDNQGKLVSKKYYEDGEQIEEKIKDKSQVSSNTDNKRKALVSTAKDIFKSLLMAIFPIKKGKFSDDNAFQVSRCKLDKKKLLMLLISKRSFLGNFSFEKGCDVSGSYRLVLNDFFPMNFKIQHVANFNNVVMQFKITTDIKGGLITLDIEAKDGRLSSSEGDLLFSGDYQLVLNPMGQGGFMKENVGGTFKVIEIFEEKVSYEESIIVDMGK